MEPSSQVSVLEGHIRDCYGRVVWTHKTHEKCADILLQRQSNIKIWLIVATSLSATGMLAAIVTPIEMLGVLATLLSTLSLCLTIYTKDYDLGGIAQDHKVAAQALWAIREKYLSLLTDIKAEVVTIDCIIETRSHLEKELSTIYENCPRTNSFAYKQAAKALKRTQELTFSSDEIDQLLPSELRRKV